METYNHLNGLTLAYVGDAIYEIYIRSHLVKNGIIKPNHLHKCAKQYVSAKAQAELMKALIDAQMLTEEEYEIYRRGRNAKSHTSAKNTDIVTYRVSTGFEAIFGYLHLINHVERLETLVKWCIDYIGEKHAETTTK